tara:strand:+ start:118 stop:579 length:462 start_codon:yes stop_codon:yes gene_type:complete
MTENELKSMTQEDRVKALGMTSEQLTGRSMFMEFDPGETERFEYPWAPQVDFNKRTELDSDNLTSTEVNNELRRLMAEGYGTIVLKNPRGKHSLAVGILSKLNLIIEGSTGYFGVGLKLNSLSLGQTLHISIIVPVCNSGHEPCPLIGFILMI